MRTKNGIVQIGAEISAFIIQHYEDSKGMTVGGYIQLMKKPYFYPD